MDKLAVMIMAAGEGKRFGGCKPLAEINGKSLLEHSLEISTAVAGEHVYVVTGCYHHEIDSTFPNANLIYNADWSEGLGNSIASGVSELADRYQSILILLADQWAVTVDDLERLVAAKPEGSIACAQYENQLGVPAAFDRANYAELIGLSGDQGAKRVVRKYVGQGVIPVGMTRAAQDLDFKSQVEV